MLRWLALSWLVFEGGWALFRAFVSWPAPVAQVWLMDLGVTYLVARQLPGGATVGRALVVGVGMFLWAPALYAMAFMSTCGTHALTVGFQAVALVIMKTVILVSAALWRVWRKARDAHQAGETAPARQVRGAVR